MENKETEEKTEYVFSEIVLSQVPVITHSLKTEGAQVKAEIAKLNIKNQVATPETEKALKKMRTKLNKMLEFYEDQRKAVKKAVLKPYDELETEYNSEIKTDLEDAIKELKTKLDEIDVKLKAEKKQAIVNYFNELVLSSGIDFITFENVGIDIIRSNTDKSYKDKCRAFVEKVESDVTLIRVNLFEDEIMVEYKANGLNVSKAIVDVTTRKQKAKEEADKKKTTETNRRKNLVSGMGLTFMDMTNSYEYDFETYITIDDIENLSNDDFGLAINKLKETIINKQKATASNITNVPHFSIKIPTSEQLSPPKTIYDSLSTETLKAPIETPKAITQQPKPKLPFAIVGEIDPELAPELKKFFTDNSVKYKNIKISLLEPIIGDLQTFLNS